MEKFSIRRYAAIIAILMVLVMTVLDVTVVNVALPVIAGKFDVSNSAAVWIVSVYQLVITMLLLPVSSYGDLRSYRRMFLTGVVVFTLSSAGCAASGSFTMIIAARALQGIGAACVMGVNIALTRLIYPREVLGRGLALNAMVIAIATAAGPAIAGAILSVASWHWLFLINIPFGIIAFIIGYRLLPNNPPHEKKEKFDVTAGVENMLTFGLFFLAFGTFSRKGASPEMWVLLACSFLTGIIYVRREMRRALPMLPVDLFRIRLYTLSILTSVCSFIGQMLSMVSLPFILLDNYGFSEISTGLLMTPWPLATMIVSPVAARFVERHNPGLTAATGMGVFALGILLLILMPGQHVAGLDISWRMALCGVGYGMFQTPNNIVMVSATPLHRTGGAGGMQSTARLVGQTIGATLVTIIFSFYPEQTCHAVHTALWTAIGFACVAGIFSATRVPVMKSGTK